jgi:EAL domain-containing protein (putative c-di-GMP-specific phosphodiesterase class I)
MDSAPAGDAPDRTTSEPHAGTGPVDSAAEAASTAALDARTAAESAADTSLAAGEAAAATAEVARHAKVATATAVAAAAASTAHLAVQTAVAVEAEALALGLDVARSAEQARSVVAAELPADADPQEAREAATTVASAVAEEVVVRAKATADAAAVVADAVVAAADAAFVAAQSAAARVELAADMAAASGRVVAGSSSSTEVATEVVVASTARAASLSHRLRGIASLRRVSMVRDPLVEALHGAVARRELRLHYQPIYNLRTGAMSAVEALLRWQHPTRGLLPPAEFLHIAESHPDLVDPVGDWVLATAVSQAQAWQQLGNGAPKIWVNISCEQLGNDHLAGFVEQILATAGLAPTVLGLEVTERQLIRQPDAAVADLAALRDLGVSLAVDDFGTGYASLDYLRRFTFDEIKIDRSFVSGLGSDRTDTAVTSAIIALGQSLDMHVVAEGIEVQAQYDQLKRLGCDMGQGYLMQRPAPPETITAALLAVRR